MLLNNLLGEACGNHGNQKELQKVYSNKSIRPKFQAEPFEEKFNGTASDKMYSTSSVTLSEYLLQTCRALIK